MDFSGLTEEQSLFALLQDFFSSREVAQRFHFLGEQCLFGCEKWIQVEMLKFLIEHDCIPNFDIAKEDCYSTDQRTCDHRQYQYIDLTFRVRNKSYYIALELKHKKCLALAEVDSDFRKTMHMKPTNKRYFRKIFCMLVHPFEQEDRIRKKVENHNYFIGDLCFSFLIPSSNLSCSVFAISI